MSAATLLAIDTAAPRLQLALLRGDQVDTSIDDIAQGHAELIFPRINALLARNGAVYADLTRIAVITGPGSFTGVRIGVSAARGLGLALGIPVLGISTFYALSLMAPDRTAIVVLIDAKRGEMYRHEFYGPGIGVQDMPDRAEPIPDVFSNIGSPKRGLERLNPFTRYTALLGSGAEQAAEATGAENLELRRPESDRGFVDIGLVARFAADLDPKRWPPEPTYVRDADAKPQDKARIARQTPEPVK